MYAHPATQANVRRLRDDFGYAIVDPEQGTLASGAVGVGRLAEPAAIVDAVVAAVADTPIRAADERLRPPRVAPAREADLSGRHILVTAGGTAEPIDPVRFIGNRSTGIMSAAIVDAALDRGARVTVVIGHVQAGFNPGAKAVWAQTTTQMRDAVIAVLPEADALIMAAAVADFRPRQAADRKLTRDGSLTLELEPTEDILAEAGARAAEIQPRPVLVGFAAETGSLDRAPEKLRRKGADFLVANDVTEPGSGFGTATNRVTILDSAGGREDLPLLRKREVADRLLDRVARALDDRDAAAQTSAMSESRAR
jgi:phosphopantothenoylcysteine decarboxylase / phosphopantothenate---cysteine ligase